MLLVGECVGLEIINCIERVQVGERRLKVSAQRKLGT